MVRRALDLDSLSFACVVALLSGIAAIFLVLPTAILLLTSFTSSASLKFPPDGYSLRWYIALIDADQLRDAAWNSLLVAAWTTVGAVLLGVSGALAVGRSTARWARVLDAFFMSPLLLPALAFGFGGLIYFNMLGLRQSVVPLILGHVVVCAPFVVRNTVAALSQLDPGMLEASLSLGAGRLYTFRRVTLPSIGRGVAAGAFIAFMSSFDNIPVSLFLTDPRRQMLPIHMWEIIDTSLDVRTAAASGVIVLATLLLMIAAERLVGLTRQLR